MVEGRAAESGNNLTVTFVQNSVENIWIDLEECELRGLAALPVG